MKIVQVINQVKLGGAEKLVLLLHEKMLAAGHESYVISLAPLNAEITGVLSLNNSPNAFANKSDLKKALLSLGNIDVVHSHLTQSQFWLGLLRASFPDALFVTTEHSTSNRRREKWWGKLVDKKIYQPYDQIICISNGVKDSLLSWMPQLSERAETCYNGLDLSVQDRPRLLGKSGVRLVTLGRLVEKKGIDIALRALTYLPVEYSLTIIGDGEQKAPLQMLARHLQLEGRVRFAGYVEDPHSLLSESDIFLMPSRFEGFGLALVEAMAVGLPSVVSDLPGIKEVGRGEEDGCLHCRVEGEKDLKHKILSITESASFYKKLSENSLERARYFTIDKMVAGYLDVYSKNVK